MRSPTAVQFVTFGGSVCARTGTVLSWSENNIVAFCNEEGLYIMEPFVFTFTIDSSHPIAINKHFIATTSQPNVFDFGINREELQNYPEREDVFDLMLDRTLSPAVMCSPSYKGYRQAAWSPAGIGPKETCVLAALTMDHRLKLHVTNESRKWVDFAELSDVYYKHLLLHNFEMPWMVMDSMMNSRSSAKLRELKTKSYATAAMYATWSHKMDSHLNTKFSLLAVGMKNGSVVLWKIWPLTSVALADTSDVITIDTIFNGKVGTVTCLCWIELQSNSALLVVSGTPGTVVAFTVCASGSEPVTVVEAFTLWCDSDKLSVNQMCYNKVGDGTFQVVAGKGNFIVAWTLTMNSVTNMKYIVGNYLQPLIGLYYDDGFFGATADGIVFKIDLNTSQNSFSITVNRILAEIENEHMNYYGFVASPNRFMFCIVEGIVSWYDHLAVRQPIKLLYFTAKDMNSSLEALLTKMDDPETKLCALVDVLHAIHYHWCRAKELPQCLVSLLELADGQLRELSICKLQLLRWFIRLLMFTEQDDSKTETYKSLLEVVENHLMEHQLLLLVNKVIEIEADDWALDERVTSRVMVANSWLESRHKYLGQAERCLLTAVSGRIRKKGDSHGSKGHSNLAEFCRLCRKPIIFDNLHHGSCESGHLFGRCCLSLTICDQPVYKKCKHCSVIANLDMLEFLKDARCPFCSAVL